ATWSQNGDTCAGMLAEFGTVDIPVGESRTVNDITWIDVMAGTYVLNGTAQALCDPAKVAAIIAAPSANPDFPCDTGDAASQAQCKLFMAAEAAMSTVPGTCSK